MELIVFFRYASGPCSPGRVDLSVCQYVCTSVVVALVSGAPAVGAGIVVRALQPARGPHRPPDRPLAPQPRRPQASGELRWRRHAAVGEATRPRLSDAEEPAASEEGGGGCGEGGGGCCHLAAVRGTVACAAS